MLAPSRQATEFRLDRAIFVDSAQQGEPESIEVMEPTGPEDYIHDEQESFRVNNRDTMAGGKLALALAATAMVMTPAIGLAAAGKAASTRHLLEFRQDFDLHPGLGRSPFDGDVRRPPDFDRRFQVHARGPAGPSVATSSRGPRPRCDDPARPVEVAVASPPTGLAPAQI